jgi:REP element-mobilizing transposase RayT
VREVRRPSPFYIDAWVVLPDHMHRLWTFPEGDSDFPGRWRQIKSLPMPTRSLSEALGSIRFRGDVGGNRGATRLNGWDADSALEENGFELAVPPRRERQWAATQASIAVSDLNL